MKLIRKNQEGFTLVELMVVVAIIGILAAIAIPNYQKYQAKARQSEAKLALGSIHTALSSYAAENTTFTTCLQSAGFSPEAGSRRYYATGFTAAASNGMTCGPLGASECTYFTWNAAGGPGFNCSGAAAVLVGAADDEIISYPGTFTALAGGAVAMSAQLDAVVPALAVSNVAFTAGAAGQINTTAVGGMAVYDNWTIDNTKNMQNVQPNL